MFFIYIAGTYRVPTVERSEGCRVLTLAVSALLDFLGWDHAKEGDKALSFAPAFDLLKV